MICLQSAFSEGPCFVWLLWILEETGHPGLCLWMCRGLPLSSCPGRWVLRARPQSVPFCCLSESRVWGRWDPCVHGGHSEHPPGPAL